MCQDEATRDWLKENSGSFFQLAEMFMFFKEKMDKEAEKHHCDTVDIIFVAHGRVSRPMVAASRLLPLSSITDVLLHSPWNCVTDAEVTYGIATGKMKPEHRSFYCSKKPSCPTADAQHRPTKLPDRWNSLREAGGQMIPSITVSPLQPWGGVWDTHQSLVRRYGPPGRGRIVIPFILPGTRSVPFPVVALALALLSSRLKATVHLDVCLSQECEDARLDEKHLEQQYSCTVDATGMIASQHVFREAWFDAVRHIFTS